MKKNKSANLSRRKFLGISSSAGAAFTIVPSFAVSGLGHVAPSDKLNIAAVGVGGIGLRNLQKITGQNIVALCDIDWDYAAKAFKAYPAAKVHKDYRLMLENQKDIDAVMIATPDHTHATIGMASMKAGKHVFIEKPLAHSVYETRMLTEAARENKVATQMGNMGNSNDNIRLICEWIWEGAIGEVTEVHTWTNRPIWPQGLERPTAQMKVPKTLDWDLFLGPAPFRPYHSAYTPWNWRAWWDFGTGALGDMGCHIIDPVFKALNLRYPVSVQASSTQVNTESAPNASRVRYDFPARDNMPKCAMPPVTVYWYDGGLKPDRPEEMEDGEALGNLGGGCVFIGSKGKIVCGLSSNDPKLLPAAKFKDYPTPKPVLRRVPGNTNGHWDDWVRACKESPENRVPASSNFDYAGPFSETVVMGNLAVRLQDLKKPLLWDGEAMRMTNITDEDAIRVVTSDKFTVINGDPRFDTQYLTMPAKAASEEWVKRTYRKGWSL
jgi:predicted dehydrogenase